MSEPFKLVSEVVTTTARTLVSRDKFRLRDPELGVDLDLTYITERIIAMGLPCAKLDSLYRNHENDVAKYLNHKHGKNYMIFNLTKKKYSFRKFHFQVRNFSWPDHHAPCVNLLRELVDAMASWLMESPNHVIAVHCLAGRGRTGTAISCLLYYLGICKTVSEATRYFARARSKTGEGVAGPSQFRYCDYFQHIALYGEPKPNRVTLAAIELQPIPAIGIDGKFCPNFEICSPASPKIPFYSNVGTDLKYGTGDYSAKMFCDVVLEGDVLIRVLHQHSVPGTTSLLFRIQFHTSFISNSTQIFQRADIDAPQAGPLTDSRFPQHFRVTLFFAEPSPFANIPVSPQIPSRPKSTIIPQNALALRDTKPDAPLGLPSHSLISSPPKSRRSHRHSYIQPVQTRVPSYRTYSPTSSTTESLLSPLVPQRGNRSSSCPKEPAFLSLTPPSPPTSTSTPASIPSIPNRNLTLEERMQNLLKPS